MQQLKGCLLLALFYCVNSFAEPVNTILKCANGTHATMKDGRLSVEGIFSLPFEGVESEDNDHIVLMFTDAHVKARMLIRYADAKFFLQNSDGSWIPCKAYRINS